MGRLAELGNSAVLAVDIQPRFLAPIQGAASVVSRSRFVLECARVLGVPILGSEQIPDRMGGTCDELADLLPATFGKGRFSCAGEPAFEEWLTSTERTEVVLIGIETPICVMQTALDLLARGVRVDVVEDAVGGRSIASHSAALERLRAAGAEVLHSESLVYEWMRTAEHPEFRSILSLVKAHA